jgi:hypothetical protein
MRLNLLNGRHRPPEEGAEYASSLHRVNEEIATFISQLYEWYHITSLEPGGLCGLAVESVSNLTSDNCGRVRLRG